MGMMSKPNFNQPTPVGQNILPPAPQAPIPQIPQGSATPPPAGPNQTPPPAQPNLQQSQPSRPTQPPSGGGGQFDAPIPGQSLTDDPGNAKWEHPPQYTDPKKAADMVWTQLMNKKNIEHVAVMLHNGVPVEAIARTVLFGGFSQGKWTPDVAMLIAKPVLYMIAAIGSQAGLDDKMKISMPKDKNDPEDPINMMAQAQAQEKSTKKQKSPEDRKSELIKGFLPRDYDAISKSAQDAIDAGNRFNNDRIAEINRKADDAINFGQAYTDEKIRLLMKRAQDTIDRNK